MQKYFVGIFATVSIKNLDIFPDIFIKYWKFSKYFPLRIQGFFLSWKTTTTTFSTTLVKLDCRFLLKYTYLFIIIIYNICFKPFCIFSYANRKIIKNTYFFQKSTKTVLPYGGGGGGSKPYVTTYWPVTYWFFYAFFKIF